MRMKILAHTMEYRGEAVTSPVNLRNYQDSDYEIYKKAYEACFHEMRAALQLTPVDCCAKRENLLRKCEDVFVYEKDGRFIGSVAIYQNEIDDLFVAGEHQKKGYGRQLLWFAVSYLQKKNCSPILLHVADWNQEAVELYRKNGFVITKTEYV